MLKRTLSLFLALTMVLSFCPMQVWAEEPQGEILPDAAQEGASSAQLPSLKADHTSSDLSFAVSDGTLPFSDYEYEVLIRTNRERLSRGYSPLLGFDTLQEACDIRAKEAYGYFSHTRPNGTSCFTVLTELNLVHYGAGENIALGHRDPQQVVTAWMNSSGHRANILNSGFGFLGVGYYNYSWVQMFMGAYGSLTSATVNIPEGIMEGTTIDEMNLYAVVQSDVYGPCYLPITQEYVSGYDPDVVTPQEIRIDFLGFSGTVTITLVEKLDTPRLTASNIASSGKIKLSWKAIDGAEKYRLYRSDSQNGTYKLVKTTSNTSFTNTSVTAGKTYYYYLVAVDPYGNCSDNSKTVARTCDLKQPVVTVSNVSSSGKIKVSWEKISGAKEYKVYRATSEDGDFTLMKTTTSTSYTNTSAKAGQTYYYKVKAIASTSSANSAYSQVHARLCKLGTPDVTISNVSSTGQVRIQWDSVSGAAQYLICRATAKDGEFTALATITETGYTDMDTQPGRAYYYQVKALHDNLDANSPFCETKSRTCDLPQPTVTISNVASSGKIRLTWEAVEGAVEYKVYRATSKNGTYKLMKTTTGTTYTNTSASAGTTYYYKVKAIAEKEAANSAYSEIKSRTCDLKQPEVSIKESSKGYPRLTWSKVSGAKEYKVYRSTDGVEWTLMKTTTSTSYTNSSAKDGMTYHYRVRAIASKSAANSAYSQVMTFTMA